jgi:hypothetical protein
VVNGHEILDCFHLENDPFDEQKIKPLLADKPALVQHWHGHLPSVLEASQIEFNCAGTGVSRLKETGPERAMNFETSVYYCGGNCLELRFQAQMAMEHSLFVKMTM